MFKLAVIYSIHMQGRYTLSKKKKKAKDQNRTLHIINPPHQAEEFQYRYM